ncbi:hypothetical protein M0805_006548 [Coniferiporia weirii]|nr:hypothetical protein M0805_006548 [Coniferiporia weirii]
MDAIDTPITRLLNIRTPIIAPPMAGASGGALAAQVSLAGGFGFMAAGYDDAAAFLSELKLARSVLQDPLGTNNDSANHDSFSGSQAAPVAIGVGFIGWKLDEPDGKTAELLSIALEARVAAVWFAFGVNLGKWVHLVRSIDNRRSSPHKTLIFVLVNTLQEANVAVDEWDVDVLVAQGIESGGHGHGAAPPLLALVPEILKSFENGRQADTLTPQSARRTTPVLAAGGLATGAHAAALLTLGASGVVLGTRFLLTPEARYTSAQKAALLAAHATSTVRTTAFDAVRGTEGWPAGIDGRALRNTTVERVERGGDLEEARRYFQDAAREGDPAGMLVWSGTGIGLVNEIKPAGDVVAELHQEMIDRLRAASALINVTRS